MVMPPPPPHSKLCNDGDSPQWLYTVDLGKMTYQFERLVEYRRNGFTYRRLFPVNLCHGYYDEK